ncbi:hypothetical protein CAEBREN_24397 [Caenorhabditis brenneri]|uniref:GH18 domain-containing protein n=1 Tax=Caenorhabditis brenneri TaxID=135651 RepID=G0NN44_CAEBE|nr:hypothetical protein CAEBREN_24397 [Caenorhabditis brenneri]
MDVPKEPNDPLLDRPGNSTIQRRKCIRSNLLYCGIIVILLLLLSTVGLTFWHMHYLNKNRDQLVNSTEAALLEMTTSILPPTVSTTTEGSPDAGKPADSTNSSVFEKDPKFEQSNLTFTSKDGEKELSSDESMDHLRKDHKQRNNEEHVLEDVTSDDDNSTYLLDSKTKKPQNITDCERRVVCIYESDPRKDFTGPTDEQLSMLTHIIYYPLDIHLNGTISLKIDYDLQLFEKLLKKAKKHGVKMMISTVELNEGMERTMEHIIRNEERRQNLIDSLLNLIQLYKLDGVDVHWRWTYRWQQEVNLIAFCKRLREKLNELYLSSDRADPYIISVSTGVADSEDPGTKHVSKYVDFFNIETDSKNDFNSWYGDTAWPTLFSYEKRQVDKNLKYFSCLMNTPNKLNLVLQFYETDFHAFGTTEDTPYELRSSPLSIHNARKNLEEKVKYAMNKNIGGLAIRTIRNDHHENTLLEVVSKTRKCSRETYTNTVKYDCD